MSHCIEPNWNLKTQRRRRQQQQQVEEEEEETKRSSFHMFNPCNNKNQHLVPVYELITLSCVHALLLLSHTMSDLNPN